MAERSTRDKYVYRAGSPCLELVLCIHNLWLPLRDRLKFKACRSLAVWFQTQNWKRADKHTQHGISLPSPLCSVTLGSAVKWNSANCGLDPPSPACPGQESQHPGEESPEWLAFCVFDRWHPEGPWMGVRGIHLAPLPWNLGGKGSPTHGCPHLFKRTARRSQHPHELPHTDSTGTSSPWPP